VRGQNPKKSRDQTDSGHPSKQVRANRRRAPGGRRGALVGTRGKAARPKRHRINGNNPKGGMGSVTKKVRLSQKYAKV